MISLRYISWTVVLALKLSAIRWIQMVMDWPSQPDSSILYKTLWMGYRFDLLLLGFWLAPLAVFLVVKKVFVSRGVQGMKLAKAYLVCSWIFITALYFRDLVYFPVYKEHMWLEDHLANPFLSSEVWQSHEWWAWIWIGIVTWGLAMTGLIRFDRWLMKLKDISWVGIIVIFLWTAFIARGSLGSDHLRRNDCDYAPNRTIKSFCMNPLYTFSKTK